MSYPARAEGLVNSTCVNKRKNSGSRWMSNKNIIRTQTAWVRGSWSQLGTRCWSESLRQTQGFEPSVTHGWATPAKMRKKCCYGQKNLGQYVAVCPRLQLTSHKQPTSTLSRIKCERYIFIKKCVRSFVHWSRRRVWLRYPYICIRIVVWLWLYNRRGTPHFPVLLETHQNV